MGNAHYILANPNTTRTVEIFYSKHQPTRYSKPLKNQLINKATKYLYHKKATSITVIYDNI